MYVRLIHALPPCRLDLSGNTLTDNVTAFPWSSLPALQQLELQDNTLQGSVPASLLTLPQLTSLNLANNGLTGLLPPLTAAQLQASNLTALDLSGNQLYGPLPDFSLISPPLSTLALDQSAGYLFDCPAPPGATMAACSSCGLIPTIPNTITPGLPSLPGPGDTATLTCAPGLLSTRAAAAFTLQCQTSSNTSQPTLSPALQNASYVCTEAPLRNIPSCACHVIVPVTLRRTLVLVGVSLPAVTASTDAIVSTLSAELNASVTLGEPTAVTVDVSRRRTLSSAVLLPLAVASETLSSSDVLLYKALAADAQLAGLASNADVLAALKGAAPELTTLQSLQVVASPDDVAVVPSRRIKPRDPDQDDSRKVTIFTVTSTLVIAAFFGTMMLISHHRGAPYRFEYAREVGVAGTTVSNGINRHPSVTASLGPSVHGAGPNTQLATDMAASYNAPNAQPPATGNAWTTGPTSISNPGSRNNTINSQSRGELVEAGQRARASTGTSAV